MARMPIPSVEGKLAGKRILVVIDNQDFALLKEVVRDCVDVKFPYSHLKTCDFTELLKSLPAMKTDVLVIFSPRYVKGEMDIFEAGLIRFKSNNPRSVVVMNNLHSPASEESAMLKGLASSGLVHHLEHGYMFFPRLMDKAPMLME
jgi:hypothetical protein